MVNKRVQFMISFIVLFKLRRQDTCIVWHWFEFSYKMWSMLIIHISYLHIQKKNNTNNTKYLLFGEGNVKEKIWDNLEEKNNTNSENSNNSALLVSIVSFFKKINWHLKILRLNWKLVQQVMSSYLGTFMKKILQWNLYSGDSLGTKASVC